MCMYRRTSLRPLTVATRGPVGSDHASHTLVIRCPSSQCLASFFCISRHAKTKRFEAKCLIWYNNSINKSIFSVLLFFFLLKGNRTCRPITQTFNFKCRKVEKDLYNALSLSHTHIQHLVSCTSTFSDSTTAVWQVHCDLQTWTLAWGRFFKLAGVSPV